MWERIAELEKELATLKKINSVLIGRVEKAIDSAGNDYSLFEQNIVLQQRVDQRTAELERKNLELARLLKDHQENEILLDRTGQVARVGGWQVQLDTMQVTWTAQMRRLHEVDEHFCPTIQSALDFIDPEYRQFLRDAFDKCRLYGIPCDLELAVTTAKGNKLWARLVANALCLDGVANRLFGVFMDITDRHHDEEVVRKLSEAVQQSPHSTYITDLSGTIEYANTACLIHSGYSREEVIGQNPRIFQSGKTPREVYDAMWRCLDNGGVWRGEFINRKRDGSQCIEESIISPIRDSRGNITHYLAINEDITERKKSQETLEKTNIQLKETTAKAQAANIAKSEFLANMSHEIRTPMNGIIGMLGLLQDTALNDAQSQYAKIAYESAASLLSLLNDILDFSKMESGKYSLESIDFDLREVLEKNTLTMKSLANSKGLQYHVEVDPNVPRLLRGDPARLRQVLTNLASNAIKFTPQGEVRVQISSQPVLKSESGDDIRLIVSIRDTGIGIPQDKISTLFEKFVQVDASTTRRFGGTGLGLAICKHLVELMGGQINVTSQEGVGAEFQFTACFKLCEKQLRPALPPGSTKAAINTISQLWRESLNGEPRFLLVEDDSTNQQVALGILRKFGFTVDIVDNGQKALDALKARAYDLVFMDLQMPVMDGLEATRQIRDHNSPVDNHQIPIIAMTANAMQGDRERCLQAGMTDYISKPIMPDKLNEVLTRSIATITRKTPH